MWRRGLHRQFPAFVAFALLASTEQLIVYAADIAPWVSSENFWRVLWAGLLVEGILKIRSDGRAFRPPSRLLRLRSPLRENINSRGGRVARPYSGSSAAYSSEITLIRLISGAHILEQTIDLTECGLLLFIFLFAAFFRLTLDNAPFLASHWDLESRRASPSRPTWAVMANGGLLHQRHLLDLLNMATYHVCVLIWCYYLLVPQKNATTSAVLLPEHNLDIWNRELERLLQP